MGTGIYGGFGNKTKGAKDNAVARASKKAKKVKAPSSEGKIKLPKGKSQLKHIFAEREGHLSDTPENRQRLVDLANDPSKYLGKDQYGNHWNAEITSDGSQYWVRYQGGTINNGGKNATPYPWDDNTGLNKNPKKRKKKK